MSPGSYECSISEFASCMPAVSHEQLLLAERASGYSRLNAEVEAALWHASNPAYPSRLTRPFIENLSMTLLRWMERRPDGLIGRSAGPITTAAAPLRIGCPRRGQPAHWYGLSKEDGSACLARMVRVDIRET